MPLGYLPNLIRPLLPVARVGVFVHHHGQDCVPKLRRAAEHERQIKLSRSINIAAYAAANIRPARMSRRRLWSVGDQFQLVYLRLEPVVVRGDGVDDFPHSLVCADIHSILRGRAGRAGYGQDDVSEPLALRFPHHPADRLHHVYFRAARFHKHNGVQRGDVDALRQATGVGQDAGAPVVRVFPQPRQAVGARHSVLRSINVPNLATEMTLAADALFFVRRYATFDYLREVLRERFGMRYRVAERHRSLGGENVETEVHPSRAALAKPVPATDHPRAVVHVQLGFGIRQHFIQIHSDFLQIDIEYQDFVVRQDAHFNCLDESEPMELRSVKAFVVHGGQRDSAVVARPALDGVAVDARHGGHVKPFFAGDEAVVVDAAEVGFGFSGERRASGAVRLVANYQVELRQPHPLRGGHCVQRLVSGKHHRHGGVALGASESPRESGGVGGRRQMQVEQRDVVFIVIVISQVARAGVGAYRERLDRNRGVVRPIPKRLRQQRYGRREEQNAAARPGDFLGDAERGERLAGAASHDEFAALTLAESFDDVLKRQSLIFAQALSRFSAERSRTREAEVFPING